MEQNSNSWIIFFIMSFIGMSAGILTGLSTIGTNTVASVQAFALGTGLFVTSLIILGILIRRHPTNGTRPS